MASSLLTLALAAADGSRPDTWLLLAFALAAAVVVVNGPRVW